jgi:hypothetical protein
VHGIITLFLEVIALAIILLLVGLFLVVLVFMTRVIVVLIVLILTVMLPVIPIALVTFMVVVVLATMLPVACITAASNGKMSRLLLFWLLFLHDLVKVSGCFIGSLTLFEKSYEPKRVGGHCFVHFCKFVLMRLWLCEEDLFGLLLCCGQLHHVTDIATVKVAEELYLTPHEFIYWHDGGLLGCAKSTY